METEKRKLIKFSNYSLCVTLPKWVVTELRWAKGDVVEMSVDTKKGQITIKKGVAKTEQEKTPAIKVKNNSSKKSPKSRW